MNWSRIRAIVSKDLRSISGNTMVLVPMAVVPLVFCIVLPAGLFLLALFGLENLIQGGEMVKNIIHLYPVPENLVDESLRVVYVFLNYSFLPLFMLVPIMAASILAANAVVGEKERQTLETLLYSPVTNEEFLTAKLLGAFIPGIGLGFLGFAGFFIVTNLLSFFTRGVMIVQAPIWLPTMLLLNPSVAFLGLTVTLMVSVKAKTFVEAQQVAGVVVLPFIILVVTQITGVVVFNPWLVLGFGAIILAAGAALLFRLAPRFTREEIISRL